MPQAPVAPGIKDEAIKLALKQPGLSVANPFSRTQYGAWRFDNIGVREQELEAVLRVWRDHIGDMHDPMPGETQQQAIERPGQLPINHLPEWTRLVCQTYAKPPQRVFTLKGEPQEQGPLVDALNDAYRQASVDTVLADIDSLMFLTGNAALVPWYDVEYGELVLHYYPSPCVRVVENINNPKRPKATALVGCEVTQSAAGASKVGIGQVWLPGEVSYTRGIEVVDSDAYEGPTPVVHFFETNPTDSYYVHAPGMALAGLALILINDFYSATGHLVVMQNHGLLVLKGFPENQKLTVGPGRAISFPADTAAGAGGQGETRDAYYINPGAAISETMEFLDWVVGRLEKAQGIPKSLTDSLGGGGVSGIAIQESKAPLAERRAARFERFRRPETELLRAIMWQLKRANVAPFTGTTPEDWDVRVSFPDPLSPSNVQGRLLQERQDIELGLRSPADVLQAREPARFANAEEAEDHVVDVADAPDGSGVDGGEKEDTV